MQTDARAVVDGKKKFARRQRVRCGERFFPPMNVTEDPLAGSIVTRSIPRSYFILFRQYSRFERTPAPPTENDPTGTDDDRGCSDQKPTTTIETLLVALHYISGNRG